LSAPLAAAQSVDPVMRMGEDPDKFYLYDQSDVKVLEYNTPRDVRVCNDTRRHHVPLAVNHDGEITKVRPGDCFSFEAKTVTLHAAEPLGSDLDLSGTVEHHAIVRASEPPKRTAQPSPSNEPDETRR
jgi:hypothetical protein